MPSPRKIAAIEEVQRATESAMQAVISYLSSTKHSTSEEAHRIIDETLKQHNCESPAGHIVAGGTQSAEPHEAGTGMLKEHCPIVIDIYPRSTKTGYFADMSRTVCIGTPPAELRKMYDTVLNAQERAITMIKPGVKCIAIQKAVEQVFKDAGYSTTGRGEEFKYAEGFVHSVGHGVGKDIHESPRIGRGTTDVFREGDVITIEPGLYYKTIGGVRIEDLILVTDDGYKNLTLFSKQLAL